MKWLVIVLFVIGGIALATFNFRNFPFREEATRGERLMTLAVHVLIGAGIGFLAGGWAAGRLPG